MLLHPGVSGGPEWTLYSGERLDFGGAAEAGVSWHPRNQVSTWARAEAFGRRHGSRGGTQELFVSAGPMWSAWAVDTVRVEADGTVSDPLLPGTGYLTGSVGVGFGKRTDGAIDSWIIRPQLVARIPHFYGPSLTPAVEVGVRFGGA